MALQIKIIIPVTNNDLKKIDEHIACSKNINV